ncbi:MAG: hypothetical protein ACRECX_09985 [Methyloceanibacter sp.]|uniref:hypothetical protein n=1 Tax=Methyloceanibacter sp. TaxID=1965321 RepID=UPI003D6C9C61
MNRRRNVIVVALAALVAGAAVLVYAQDGKKADPAPNEAGAPAGSNTLDEPPAKSQEPAADAPKVLYDLATLPDPVQRMLTEIILTAQSGDIEAMRPVLESNELKPMVAAAHVDDPIAYWKEQSVDGTGRDVLAAMLNVLASGFVLTGTGHDEMYVWPYFAEVDITKLTPEQEVELYRTVPPQLAVPMKKSGKYTYYRLGVSPTGVWHYFLQ